MPINKLSYEEMGWKPDQYKAANRAATNTRRGNEKPAKHVWLEKMSRQEVAAYLVVVDGWLQAYTHARDSGKLYHPSTGDTVTEWPVTDAFKTHMTAVIGLCESVLRRAQRHADKMEGRKS